jgi:ribosomal protein L9
MGHSGEARREGSGRVVTLGLQMDMAEKIKAMGPLVLKRKVGAGNKIFGTITNKQIIEAVQKATNDGGDVHSSKTPRCCIPHNLSPTVTL